jgi:CBS domain containing-hemolysin-like protein
MDILVVVSFAALAMVSLSLLKSYRNVSLPELKRRAREGDKESKALYQAAAYGGSLGAVLWFLAGLSSGIFFWSLSNNLSGWLAVIIGAIFIWTLLVWLPTIRETRASMWLAITLAPTLAWLLGYIHSFIERVVRLFSAHWPTLQHTGLYDTEDLLQLLEEQHEQPDNRIGKLELGIAHHALTFGNQLVREVMVPRRAIRMVSAEDALGPVLMTELHDSGHSRFPVYEGKKDNIVGTLFLRDLVKAKTGGLIKNIMRPEVYYVHEEQPLTEALQAILKTHRHLFIVVNSFEEYVGIITIEDILEQIVGRPIIDEFDEYEDLRAVAARAAKKEHKEHTQSKKSTPDEPEVVELSQ